MVTKEQKDQVEKIAALAEKIDALTADLALACDDYERMAGFGVNEISGGVSMVEDGVIELKRAISYARDAEELEGYA